MVISVVDEKDKWKGDFVLKGDEPLQLFKLLKKTLNIK